MLAASSRQLPLAGGSPPQAAGRQQRPAWAAPGARPSRRQQLVVQATTQSKQASSRQRSRGALGAVNGRGQQVAPVFGFWRWWAGRAGSAVALLACLHRCHPPPIPLAHWRTLRSLQGGRCTCHSLRPSLLLYFSSIPPALACPPPTVRSAAIVAAAAAAAAAAAGRAARAAGAVVCAGSHRCAAAR